MPAPLERGFDHEKLEVYRETIAFIAWLSALLEGTVRIGDVKDQQDRASTINRNSTREYEKGNAAP